MAVFRATDGTDDGQKLDYDGEQNDDQESVEVERDQLNRQRTRFNQADLPDKPSLNFTKERQALGQLPANISNHAPKFNDPDESKSESKQVPPPGRRSLKGLKSSSGKKVMAGLAAFLIPTAIGLILLALGAQLGITLEHIHRVTTGLRFGGLHTSLNRRFNHVRREYVRTNIYQTGATRQFAPYTKTTLGARLLGVQPSRIYNQLSQRGYDLEYSRFRGGSITTKGSRTLTQVTYPPDKNGARQVKQINNTSDALTFLSDVQNDFDDLEVARFRATRSSFLLSKQIGIPFLRFRAIINGLRDGSLRNTVRGSPVNFIQQRISEEILNGKNRLGQKLPRLTKNLKRFNAQNLVATTQQATLDQVNRPAIDRKLQASFDGRQKAFRVASTTSAVVAVVTLACVIRELGTMIRDAFKMKVRGLQDNAATLITTTSQIKAGDIEGEVINDMSQRFEGFPMSANYQVGIEQKPAGAYLGVEGVDYSTEFSPKTALNGWSIEGIMNFSDLLSPANFIKHTEAFLSLGTGFVKSITNKLLGFFGKGLSALAQFAEDRFKKLCEYALTTSVQVAILATELIATVIITIASAGLGGGAKVGISEVIKALTRSLTSSIILGVAGGVALDILLFDFLLPSIVKNASGVETALLPGDTLQNGARNYASIDYGMHYLKEAEALNMGGSQIPVRQGLAQSQAYLAQQHQAYAAQGLLNNIFALDNPYSLATSLAVAQSGGGSWRHKTQAYLGHLVGSLSNNLDIFPVAQAQTDDQAALLQILYPDQAYVIGFRDQETEGEVADFEHATNTVYVENNLDRLREEYSACIGLDVAEFLLTKTGAVTNEYGHEYYPQKCDQLEARRYKMYYQDCLLIDGLERWGTNTSPMFSSRCDHLLSTSTQDILTDDSLDQAALNRPVQEIASTNLRSLKSWPIIETSQLTAVADGDIQLSLISVNLRWRFGFNGGLKI